MTQCQTLGPIARRFSRSHFPANHSVVAVTLDTQTHSAPSRGEERKFATFHLRRLLYIILPAANRVFVRRTPDNLINGPEVHRPISVFMGLLKDFIAVKEVLTELGHIAVET